MPKVYLTDEDRRDGHIQEIITDYRKARNLKICELCKEIGMSRKTFYTKIRNPGSFTVDEISAIYKTLEIPKSTTQKII